MKRVLLTGASGLLGRAVFAAFDANADWEVCGTALSRVGPKLTKLDLTDDKQVGNLMAEFKPQIVIHCAAERRPDNVEKNEQGTKALNVDATRSVCQHAASVDAPVIYISTDYVFDGTDPPYPVDAPTNPINKYGKSKLDGEKVTMEVRKSNLILRVPVLYGEVESLDESAVTIIFKQVNQSDLSEVQLSDYEIKYPTHVEDVAKVLIDLCNKKLADPSLCGTFHWSGDEALTKYQQAVVMATVFDLPHAHFRPDKKPSGGAPRPRDPHLDTSRVESLGIRHQRVYKESIRKVLEPFYKKAT